MGASYYNLRWPKGHPLGGRFRPRHAAATSAPGLAAAMLRGLAWTPALERYGVSQGQAAHIQAMLGRYGAALVQAVSRRHGDAVAYAMADHPVVWGEFGELPMVAWYDAERRAIVLNPRYAHDPQRLLRAYVHEMAHALDMALGNGRSGTSSRFAPVHRELSRLWRVHGPLRIWHDTRLAYPMTEWYGLARGLSDPREEYLPILSELYLLDPQGFAQLEAALQALGYRGPALRDILSDLWGVAPPPQATSYPQEWRTRLDLRPYGVMRKVQPWRW